ncbi:MAG TPA: hypothetical protein VJ948_02910 [Acidimicrobiia bacterium]|nr:hypothetical protein [Acidimicrobiia bacterium]
MKTHRFDAISFVAGLVATVIGLVFLIPADPTDLIDFVGDVGSWFWPAVLIAIGVAVIAPLVLSGRDQSSGDASEG